MGGQPLCQVELDFVPGTVFRAELWGGLALGILLPHERSGRFEITARSELTLRSLPSQQTLGRYLVLPGR